MVKQAERRGIALRDLLQIAAPSQLPLVQFAPPLANQQLLDHYITRHAITKRAAKRPLLASPLSWLV